MAAKNDLNDGAVEQLLDTADLASALESDRFKQFLDHIPIAIAVSELRPSECVVYVNLEFERLTGQVAAELEGKAWDVIVGHATASDDERRLSDAIADEQDYIGVFSIEKSGETGDVDAWSNIIEDDDGKPVFRLIALADVGRRDDLEGADQRLRDKDTLLRELQHRVRNNLQMITALIRLEARNMPDDATDRRFDRLAGRVEALALLYNSLSVEGAGETIDLGVYLGEIATAVMHAHAVEGIHFSIQVDTWPVSINVAMPAGLVVNELLTNALKHAFAGREGGTIWLKSLVDDHGCRVVIADDGVGLPDGVVWPKAGKLGAMIVRSLRENAKATLEVESAPGQGMKVTIFFARANAAAPENP
ncbi:MAG TPA: histidine kinase dimerization/phosphoacceptor domain -containing protein [Caulobacteraceae bacterium]